MRDKGEGNSIIKVTVTSRRAFARVTSRCTLVTRHSLRAEAAGSRGTGKYPDVCLTNKGILILKLRQYSQYTKTPKQTHCLREFTFNVSVTNKQKSGIQAAGVQRAILCES